MKKLFVCSLFIAFLMCGCSKSENEPVASEEQENESGVIMDGFTYMDDEGFICDVSYGVYKKASVLIESSSLIIGGEVISISEKIKATNSQENHKVVTVEINKIFKGSYSEKKLKFELDDTNIGYLESDISDEVDLQEGKSYLLLLNEGKNNIMLSSIAQSIYDFDNDAQIEVSGINISRKEVLEQLK